MTKRFKPTHDNKIGQAARKAAEVLEDREWTRGTVGHQDTGMCLVGAMNFAITGKTSGVGKFGIPKNGNWEISHRRGLALQLQKEFGEWLKDSGFSTHTSVMGFNDDKKLAQNKEQLVQLLHKFADEKDPQRP